MVFSKSFEEQLWLLSSLTTNAQLRFSNYGWKVKIFIFKPRHCQYDHENVLIFLSIPFFLSNLHCYDIPLPLLLRLSADPSQRTSQSHHFCVHEIRNSRPSRISSLLNRLSSNQLPKLWIFRTFVLPGVQDSVLIKWESKQREGGIFFSDDIESLLLYTLRK